MLLVESQHQSSPMDSPSGVIVLIEGAPERARGHSLSESAEIEFPPAWPWHTGLEGVTFGPSVCEQEFRQEVQRFA
jgi:hypothetical protein